MGKGKATPLTMSNCRSCDAEIIWIKMKSGANMPCHPKTQRMVTPGGEVVEVYEPHWVTCPDAKEWRKRA